MATSYTYFQEQDNWLCEQFSTRNCIVYGKKGTGKDLLFSHSIYLLNQVHYSNIPYSKKSILFTMKDLDIKNNFLNVLDNSINKTVDRFIYGTNFYISDGGIYLPSSQHKILDEELSPLPLYFALSRHLGEHNIHINTQALSRIWIKLREQADCYIRVLDNEQYEDFIILHCITYDSFESAERNLLPEQNLNEQYGEIEYRSFYIQKKELLYDTHYFRKVFYIQ